MQVNSYPKSTVEETVGNEQLAVVEWGWGGEVRSEDGI